MSLTRNLYRALGIRANVRAILRGPRATSRRATRIVLGRRLGHRYLWRRLMK